jgi:hypothetical protein
MRRRPSAFALAGALVVAWLAGTGGRLGLAADLPLVACSADRPVVELDGAVSLRVWARPPAGSVWRYTWEAPVGRMSGQGARARWALTGLPVGTYAATAQVSSSGADSVECVVRVVVRRDPGKKGLTPPSQPGRETGSALLLPGVQEASGYGLYSYLLFGAPPSGADRERHVKAIEAYWGLIPDIMGLEQYVQRSELNIAYLPVLAAPNQSVTAEWVLTNYDYARARSLLRYVRGATRNGPYIVSALKPVGSGGLASSQYLFQDLSAVPPQLVAAWVKEFLNQAAQERFWDDRSGTRLALRLRLTISVLGEGLPEVRKAMNEWISWNQTAER